MYMFSMRKVKASIRVILLVLKNPALSEVQRSVFYSLLKNQFTRDNAFAMRSIKWKSRKKVLKNPESYAVGTFR